MDTPKIIVGIGASAGGLEALEQFFAAMPVETKLAFVVVQHLSPDFRSVMDELIARRTAIPVTLVEDGVTVEANHIYLIPPKKEMIIVGGRLLLSDKATNGELVLPIDIFFRSLAQDAGDRAVGVVLSGGGSDGSRGIRDIHDAGGLVLAQDESTAAFDGMPRSARDTGVVDHVSAPGKMPELILSHAERLERGEATRLEFEAGNPPRGINAVYGLLQRQFGIDFSHYKPTTVVRRIERRLQLGRSNDVDSYVERLASESGELDALYRDLLIGVTRFFRDEEAFDLLERVVVPEVLQRAAKDEVRVWIPGCATGEEAYSIAILFHEAMSRAGDPRRLKIFATDAHTGSLEIANRGYYSDETLGRVTPERLERYFERAGSMAQVTAELRQAIVFARHNVIRDAPFTKLDLVSCRNLLIYLQPVAQRKVLGLFHFGLKNQGIMFLGPSESPGAYVEDFEAMSSHWRIYRKRREYRFAVDNRIPTPRASDVRVVQGAMGNGQYSLSQTIGVYDALLEQHMPPSLLLNERRELVHAFRGAGRFVRVKDGRPSLDILDLVEPELKMALTGALQRATKERMPVTYKGVRLTTGDEETAHRLTVRPLYSKSSHSPHLLVELEPEITSVEPVAQGTEYDLGAVSRAQLDSLESELRYTKENLQATLEEVETSNEELQSTNEELLAANEELQSTNEELQSVNEELYTVNAEYQKKIAQLTELTNDMDNLLLSTDVGTIFVDAQLCIRKFTPRVGQTFNLLPQDIGRPLASFSHTLDYPSLMTDIAGVLATHKSVEREVKDRNGCWFLMRVLPYRTSTGAEGVVLTLVDIAGLKAAEDQIRSAVTRRDQFLAMLSHELRNPLNAIVTAARLLSAQREGKSVKEIEIIDRQSGQMTRLLDELLEANRITHDKIDLHKRRIDLREVVGPAIEAIESHFHCRRIEVHADTGNEPVVVEADAARLQQVLVNILGNAAKYTDHGGRVECTLRREGGYAVVRVKDNGIGIESSMVDKIFDLFVQCTSSLARTDGGMGVGLTLVRALVELHGGTVTAHSDGLGRGTEFVIRLPVLPRGEQADVPRAPASMTTRGTAGVRVAIVDDNEDSCLMLEEFLKTYGYDVYCAFDGEAGIEVIERVRPAIAIIDIGLPKLTGYEVAERLRASRKNDRTYLVALTGYGRPSDRADAKKAGFDEHLVKPLQPKDLQRVLQHRPMDADATTTAEE